MSAQLTVARQDAGMLLAVLSCALCRLAAAAMPTPLPAFAPDTVLLVVAPHPDDETLCCAGVMQAVRNAGGHVSIVWITNGDGSRLGSLAVEHDMLVDSAGMRDLGERRMREARRAAADLGVEDAHLYFLGYPDRGLQALVSDHFLAPYRSPFTAASAVPYASLRTAGHAYTGERLEQDLAQLLDEVKPTLILLPTSRDTHPDHRASGLLTLRVATRRGIPVNMLYWIVHGGGGWPTPRGLDRALPMEPAPRIAGLPLVAWNLTRGTMQHKLRAIEEYHTQTRVMASFLFAFVRTSELFTTVPDAGAASR